MTKLLPARDGEIPSRQISHFYALLAAEAVQISWIFRLLHDSLLCFAITSKCIKAYEDIIGKKSAVYAALSDISRFMFDCCSPCGPIVHRLDKWVSVL